MKTMKKIIAVALLICLLATILPNSVSAAETFGLPCDSTTVNTYYRYWYGGNITNHGTLSNLHNAIDFDCRLGDPIYAVASGTVVETGYQPDGFGYYIILNHGTLYSLYAHLKSAPIKDKGYVAKGTVIGFAGSTGHSTGCHLHLEIYNEKNKSQVTDPLMTYYKSLYNKQLRIGGNSYRANQRQKKDSYAVNYTAWLKNSCIAANGDYVAKLATNGGTYFNWKRNYKFKAAEYAYTYSAINGSYVGQVYRNDVVTVKNVYFNCGYLLISCPWGKGTKDVYVRYEDMFIDAPRYANAYSEKSGSYVGRIYPGDDVRLLEITVDGWAKVLCPWSDKTYGNYNKVVWCHASDLSC